MTVSAGFRGERLEILASLRDLVDEISLALGWGDGGWGMVLFGGCLLLEGEGLDRSW